MAIIVKISRSDGQWVAEVPRARGFVASSPSLERLRKQVERGLKEFYPALARESRRENVRSSQGVVTTLQRQSP